MFSNRTILLLLSCYVLSSIGLLFVYSVSLPPSAIYLLKFCHSLPRYSQRFVPWNASDSSSSPCLWPGVRCYPNNSFQVKALNLSGFGLSGVLNDSISYLCLHKRLLSLDLSGNSFSGGIPQLLGNCGQLNTILLNDNSFQGPIPPELFRSKQLLRLDLGYNSLSGNIPPQVSLCIHLEYIGLYNNYLSGELPSEILSLPHLKRLYLNTNNFTGSLPEVPTFCSISDIWIHENELSGSLPPSLSNCHNLTMLIASYNNFGGIILPEIFKGLLQLEVLHLDENNLEGEIPETLWGLEGLQELVLSANKLNGSIPERIAQCHLLTDIALSGNKLVGQIPRSIGDLKRLEHLFLFDNILDGPLPPQLGSCASLVELRLQNNFIGGTIPPEICNLGNLKVLFLFNNHIKGHIPLQIGRMSSLVELALYNNSLSGSVPPGINQLTNLTFLSLAHNDLTGQLPSELGKNNFPGLIKLDLTGNNLYGPIPSSICSGNSLSVLALGNNRFDGSFPIGIETCSSLRRLIISNNLLQGCIPADLSKNSGISFLDVRGNLLHGTIPPSLGYWSNLTMLDFSENRLSGTVPPELGKLEHLQILRLSSNKLAGRIPSELGHCANLIKLDLGKNELSGSIPLEITSLGKLQSLYLEENKLSGAIPETFSSSYSLFELQLGSNLLEGPVPCSLVKLHLFSSALNLSNNRLTGNIPVCLGDLDKLEILDLSSNRFSGEVPTELNSMISLIFVNISFNQLSGRLPSAWLKLEASYPGSFLGNPGLCLLGNEEKYCEEARNNHTRERAWAAVIIGVVISVTLLCALVLVIIARGLGKKSTPGQSPLPDCRPKTEDLPQDLKFEDIMRATEGSSDKYVIGRGKHGSVYRAKSADSRNDWAVKKMAGYCIKDGYGYIVTDYMPGGTLFDVLHRSEPRLMLDWEARYRIASGVAQGLSYLHHDSVQQIIHRDIKTDNILMDSELEPKIGDFGMAKLVNDSDSSSTRSVIVGTLGYMAPENAYSTRLTEKCDVYSYGVVLLELLCRKLPVDSCFEDGLDIVSWTRKNLQENDECICFLDEEISYWGRDGQQKALKLLDMALDCTEQVADRRPSMRDVVGFLTKLNDNHARSKCSKVGNATGEDSVASREEKELNPCDY
ncbi:Receptor-like protein kinase [Morella rubra]|uniref:non-specific serine/threonine protein kinase n=1 Tax=Morella rubra TaxID=262757 RepID=A0A6A1UZH4_9ROSI|nr:Receptor-like protein kinase [Morella rubra]